MRHVIVIAGAAALWAGAAAADCACQSIALKSTGISMVYCTPSEMEANECQSLGKGQRGCKASEWAYQCALGASIRSEGPDTIVGWAFEVRATLKPGSDPAECDHGQVAQRTAVLDGKPVINHSSEDEPDAGTYEFQEGPEIKVVAAPKPYPQLGAVSSGLPLYGADGYTEDTTQTNLLIRQDAPQIVWIDTPDFPFDDGETGDVNWQFISFVDDPDDEQGGACWCQFTIERTWRGGVPGGAGLHFVAGLNCQTS